MNALAQAFALNLEEGLEIGGAVSVWQHGRELCTICGGESRPGENWQPNTLVPIYSATKVAAAACLLQALYECCRTPELQIGDLWPRFPQPQCTVAQLLSHQVGLAALCEPAPLRDLDACRKAIEMSTPLWSPPKHGYHPQTFGPMVDILMLELTGMRVGDFWEQKVRAPMNLEFYIGHVPEEQYPNIAHLRTARMTGSMPRSPFYREYFDASSAIHRAFHSIIGFDSAREMNTPAAWLSASPAKGGVASARGLAAFYQALLGNHKVKPFASEVREWMSTPQCSGEDMTLLEPTAFTCGAMYEPNHIFRRGGFGHAGAGGSIGLCEPSSGISFAYVMRGMELGNLPGKRVVRLLDALDSML